MLGSRHPGIPKGFRRKAQGCEERATLGTRVNQQQPQRGCVIARTFSRNPVGVGVVSGAGSQGRRGAPTLGWRTESRWDSPRGARRSRRRRVGRWRMSESHWCQVRFCGLKPALPMTEGARPSGRWGVGWDRSAREDWTAGSSQCFCGLKPALRGAVDAGGGEAGGWADAPGPNARARWAAPGAGALPMKEGAGRAGRGAAAGGWGGRADNRAPVTAPAVLLRFFRFRFTLVAVITHAACLGLLG